jgi:glutamate dehydrogenase
VATEPNLEQIASANPSDASRLRQVAIFAERMFARLAADLTSEFSSARRAVLAESGLKFFARREEPIKVRAFAAPGNDGLIIVETVMPDCPFIVDSIREYFRGRDLSVRTLLHPLFHARRSADGEIASFEQGGAAERAESFTHSELESIATAENCRTIERDLLRVLIQVRDATIDFGAITARTLQICEETAAQRELVEVRDFLRWLVQSGFVFLGYRRYRVAPYYGRAAIVTENGASLGIMRNESASRFAAPTSLESLDEGLRKLLFDGAALIVGKTRAESEVHRRALMDDITIRRTDAKGRPIGFDRFIGLFTSKAYAEEAEHVPVLRAKLREVIEAEGLQPRTHDYKALVAAFNSFPKEELFRAKTSELRDQLRLILDVENETDVRLSLETDAVRGNVIALVMMPRDRFSAEVRTSIQAALARALAGKLVYYYLALGESYTARLHFCFAAPPPASTIVEELRAEIARLARSWDDLLRERLIARYGANRARDLSARWLPAFASHYRTSTAPEMALGDIDQIERLSGSDHFSVLIGPAAGEIDHETTQLRLYEFGEAPILSELVPLLQNFGISVISEDAYEFRLTADGQPRPGHVQAFRVRTVEGKPLERMPGAALIADAIVAVRTGKAEDDALNALTLSAGLSWRETALLRAYLAAAFQMKLGPARPALRRPFLQTPQLAGLLIKLFHAQLDPVHEAPAATLEDLHRDYLAQLASVENIADDRLARTILAMVEATTRTNYFCAGGNSVIALKFASAKLPGLPDTPPLFEIHVNSPTMAGCHLRAGKIARGGIRYSDRFDDYRTEILGLMKTQTVKNAIIVPTGAKGGFIVKSAAGRAPDRSAIIEAYRTLIDAMLDLTDNVIEGQIVHPTGVKVRDDDGPYLVVAADKGTAAFSDRANEIAQSRGFWLGDAFASGGEHGYDHKQMGITARGAWESAKRHLRELGRAADAPIMVVGIGDMSGDVFGNGMLQSNQIKLIAAFDHRHIFIDPKPDAAQSFVERQRLYAKSNSSWADYNPAMISAGGGVFRRGQKQIQLSPEALAALGCANAELDADSLVQTILRANVDLLYNGGIGTYVRADHETDADVGDHANDSCRIAASELRSRIAVEGGNLGFTQQARIAYALAGGRINTDAIDNSAGVDMSDHEVNLKILLQPAIVRGALSESQRNRLLAAAGDEVAAGVLHDNRDQALSLSLEQSRSRSDPGAYRDQLIAIAQRGAIHRPTARPATEEPHDQSRHSPGLTRPELAELTALSKIDLVATLEQSPLIDDPYLVERFLRPYFPPSIASVHADDVARHGLRRELIATRIVNELVDLMGSVFISNLHRDQGLDSATAVRVWLVASGVLDLTTRAEALRQRATDLSAEAEIGAFLALEHPTRRACMWAATILDPGMELGATIVRYKPAFDQLAEEFDTTLTGGEHEHFERSYRDLRAAVHQEQLALELSRLAFVGHLLTVLNLSFARGEEPLAIARAYFGMSNQFEFAMLEDAIDQLSTTDRWERAAARDLRTELAWARNQLCVAILDRPAHETRADAIAKLRDQRRNEVAQLMNDLRNLRTIGLPPLQVTVRALSRLAANP